MSKEFLLSCILLLWAFAAWADPALTGSWAGTLEGVPISLTIDGRGGGRVDGRPIRYEVRGSILAIEDQGAVAIYQFELQGDRLKIAGGLLPGVLVMTRGEARVRPGAGSSGIERALVGKWCKASSFSANAGGGSQSSACFELRGDGTYVYGAERSASAYGGGAWGGTSSSSGDAGRWTATDGSITAQSSSGQTTTYRLERRNHPKNRDPMLCLDGECYVTYYQRAPW
jgi:hypothetical protein